MQQIENNNNGGGLRAYLSRLSDFSVNARLYLGYNAINGATLGIYRFLFNFYGLSLGYDEAFLGSLITVTSMSSMIAAIPAGYLADRLGRKTSMITAVSMIITSIAMMVLFPSSWMFIAMSIISGIGQSLSAVTNAPFLMENSNERERTYLFSFSSGLQMLSVFVGNWVGGYLPSWIGLWRGFKPESSQAYGWSLGAVVLVAAASLLPLLFLRRNPQGAEEQERSLFAPFAYFRDHPKTLGKLILPLLITSIGAGMIMPFRNIFYRVVYDQPDKNIGTLFAVGALTMAIGLMIAPVLAERFGKMRMVIISQGLSIPFLALMGFAPWFWLSAVAYLFRLMLMNMSNPIYQTFVMEHVEKESRATVASLVSLSWSFGWAFSPMISGKLQTTVGFGPPFMITITAYAISVFLYWWFFVRNTDPQTNVPQSM